MDEIGVFLNEKDLISSFEEARYVKIFAKEKHLWKTKKTILINRAGGEKSINEIRQEYKNVINEMDDCKIIIVTKAFGIPYSVFYMGDFSVWELEGNPFDYFDEIIKNEMVQEENENKEVEIAKKLGDGYFMIDLQELELINPEITSKKAIIPYLEKEDVKKIEVRCCHVPPWLVAKMDKGEILLSINEIKRNDYMVTVQKNV
ncbi:Fe-only nitrogenase accessory AnfO family protein [Clostridium beijerinckii]|jgi:Iron only nitrogenase protein AnfO (AnfO_nitrog).|uniref:Nitrogenase n=2 Tax=Clostridium beijerinckii TaxID=1520 RepID=A0AAW3WBG9_CLOBE|nr:Fe-only nitrogenase accessory AnfO family protein [Clostridium beijerinckii]MBC2458438.1 nitrogenase [Clostridium beijerinckii]MBC2475859.1 nitrogenase [Clostridium beijerinckii]MDG5856278.1 Fe-only nitrogenase accessory AnfO family protein [Clostridium beijerinckii]NOV59493.1 Fe-only nitrogenase accessory protein AnfO [Clostridium beijerinckii]NOV72648.1 Fe-only nitrogenase accessory protein AnfO [Clostridium beijerinckii]